MKNSRLHYISLAIVILGFASGCDDFVDADRPNSQLTRPAVFESATTANAAMADVYSQMRVNGFAGGNIDSFTFLLGSYADELISYENGPGTTAVFYQNSLLPSDNNVRGVWNTSYSQIYASNSIIEGVIASKALPEAIKNRLHGEALFVRAFVHFGLVNVFGDIPYITSTDYKINSRVARMASAQVYQKIIEDLEESIELLPAEYLPTDRTRPNKGAAQALLARVFLYRGDYAEAANMASAVINDETTYVWSNDLQSLFLKGSKTTIWQLAAGSAGANTAEGSIFIFNAGPPSLVSLSPNVVNQFEAADQRKQHWVRSVNDGSTTWYYPFKYRQEDPTGATVECTVQLRLAEQYLIRSEARVRQGELIGAKDDLNKVRLRAGLDATTATTQSEILNAVLQERRAELFTEHGHRFFDLKRFGRLDEVLGIKSGWQPTDRNWPIPLSEMQANPFLVPQNDGY